MINSICYAANTELQSRTKKLIALGPCVHDWVGMCSVGELDNGHNAALCVHVFEKKQLEIKLPGVKTTVLYTLQRVMTEFEGIAIESHLVWHA